MIRRLDPNFRPLNPDFVGRALPGNVLSRELWPTDGAVSERNFEMVAHVADAMEEPLNGVALHIANWPLREGTAGGADVLIVMPDDPHLPEKERGLPPAPMSTWTFSLLREQDEYTHDFPFRSVCVLRWPIVLIQREVTYKGGEMSVSYTAEFGHVGDGLAFVASRLTITPANKLPELP